MGDREVNGSILRRLIAVVTLSALTTGCATRIEPLYQWGDFTRLQYDVLLRSGASPASQVELMELHAAKVRARNGALPPGFRAHLGMLKLALGDVDAARSAWQAERAAFPEATHYMDRLLKNLGTPAASTQLEDNPA